MMCVNILGVTVVSHFTVTYDTCNRMIPSASHTVTTCFLPAYLASSLYTTPSTWNPMPKKLLLKYYYRLRTLIDVILLLLKYALAYDVSLYRDKATVILLHALLVSKKPHLHNTYITYILLLIVVLIIFRVSNQLTLLIATTTQTNAESTSASVKRFLYFYTIFNKYNMWEGDEMDGYITITTSRRIARGTAWKYHIRK